jgi:hypothetical protein
MGRRVRDTLQSSHRTVRGRRRAPREVQASIAEKVPETGGERLRFVVYGPRAAGRLPSRWLLSDGFSRLRDERSGMLPYRLLHLLP